MRGLLTARPQSEDFCAPQLICATERSRAAPFLNAASGLRAWRTESPHSPGESFPRRQEEEKKLGQRLKPLILTVSDVIQGRWLALSSLLTSRLPSLVFKLLYAAIALGPPIWLWEAKPNF